MSKKSFEERLQAALANTKTLPDTKAMEEIADGETRLGTIPPSLQGLLALSREVADEYNSVVGPDMDEEAGQRASRLKKQYDILRELFWCMLREHFDTDADGIGYRKAWEAVSFEAPKSPMAEMMAEMMDGDGMPDGIMVVSVGGRRGRGPFGLF